MAVQIALALKATVNPVSYFDRKNYFYPDLPKGYQITQQRIPLASGGNLQLIKSSASSVGIQRIHLEEDAGKSIHITDENNHKITLIDYNRSGAPLIEIVTCPEIQSPNEAVSFLKQIRSLLLFLGVCDGNMQEGSLRCDANLSLINPHCSRPGIKSEIKNLNSFRFLKKALQHEISRQTRLLERGEKPVSETRFWDEKKRCTLPMREKEKHKEYRFFPDPDIPPLKTSPSLIQRAAHQLPELPFSRWQRYIRKFHLSPDTACTLVCNKELGDYFEAVIRKTGLPETTAQWVTGEISCHLKKTKTGIDTFPLPASHLAELIKMVETGRISLRAAKNRILPVMLTEGQRAETITGRLGLEQLTDTRQLEEIIQAVIEKHPDQVHQYLKGKTQVVDFFIGKVMAETRGRAEPGKTKQLFKHALERYNDNSQ